MKEEVNFGFKKVLKEDKNALVKEVFDSVAYKYDFMNDAMSLFLHRKWKEDFVKEMLITKKNRLIDVGGGTGDISLKFLEKNEEAKVVVGDINYNMLERGREKFINNGLINTKFLTLNAEELPFKDSSFDIYSIAFCIRNVTDIEKALRESYRVLETGGKFFCLEFSKVDSGLFKLLYDEWLFRVIPKMGKFFSENEDAYRYLSESITKFPDQETFKKMLEKAGYKNVSYQNLNKGIATIFKGEK